MRKSRQISRNILLAVMIALIPSLSGAQQRTDAKLAQTGLKFLSVGMNARQAALGDAFTAADG
ncbi:hypothetical protein D4R75_05965, partial [bacterium]